MNIEKINDYTFMIDLNPKGIGKFISSYILKGEKTAIIECGPTSSVENLLKGLEKLGIKREEIGYVMVSHIHLDHGGGAGALLKYLPNARLIVHPKGLPHMANPQKLWSQSKQVLGKIAEIYGEPFPVPSERMIPAEDGMNVDLGDGISIRVIETLGHASHHVSYYDLKNEIVFPGDTAGIYIKDLNIILPTTPPLLVLDKTLESIEKLARLNPKMLCYTHFGPADAAVEKLRAYADQLRLWASIVCECLKKNEDLEAMKERIIERDSAASLAAKHFGNHPIMSDMFTRDIQGFIAYFERYGLK
ncbi:MBL fold metallo-hydrolase [Candidatus Bathyarchaeota archaeon]|nr:MAG: MBL fold metallo-hydrolase [Candidatus Bathyarchaeota archaeon]